MPVYKGIHAEIQVRLPASSGTPETVGYAESASLDISTGLDPYYAIGSGNALELVEGNVEITGTLSRAWMNGALLALLKLDTNNVLKDFDVFFYVGTDKKNYVYAYYCKAESTSLDISQDGIITQDIDFRAKSWAYGAESTSFSGS